MSKIEVNTVDAQCGSTITVGSSGKNVKIEGNDIRSNDYKASDGGNIINQSGTSITIGASGDTINLASGASQSGFGRSGTVNWQTAIKTSTLTAASGEGYFCNTSGGAFTVNLPTSPTVGDIVAVKDYAGTFDTHNLTVGRGGSNIEGTAADKTLSTESLSITYVYADASKGWLAVNDMAESQVPKFVTASGGTPTTSGDYKIHTFTGPGTLTVTCAGNSIGSTSIDYLVVAGGGGGATGPTSGKGGGGGGFRLSNSTCMPAPLTSPLAAPTGITAAVQSYPITVGAGSAAAANGNPSTFSSITSAGGGQGGGVGGGSGGGEGEGNNPPVSPPQGNDGGPGTHSGGGGAGAVGGTYSPPNTSGAGGDGSYIIQTGFGGCNGTPGPVGSTRYFAGGGAGGYPVGRPSGIAGGAGGGGYGGEGSVPAGAGATNTGGGGGGSANSSPGGMGGGSGIIIIRYKFQ